MGLETKRGERMDKVGIRKIRVKVENVFLVPPSVCKEISADVSERALGVRLRGSVNGKKPICQCRSQKRCRLDPWVWKIPWRRAWQHTPVLSPEEYHGQRSLAGYSPSGRTESTTTELIWPTCK